MMRDPTQSRPGDDHQCRPLGPFSRIGSDRLVLSGEPYHARAAVTVGNSMISRRVGLHSLSRLTSRTSMSLVLAITLTPVRDQGIERFFAIRLLLPRYYQGGNVDSYHVGCSWPSSK